MNLIERVLETPSRALHVTVQGRSGEADGYVSVGNIRVVAWGARKLEDDETVVAAANEEEIDFFGVYCYKPHGSVFVQDQVADVASEAEALALVPHLMRSMLFNEVLARGVGLSERELSAFAQVMSRTNADLASLALALQIGLPVG